MNVSNSRRAGHLCLWWPLAALVMLVILSLLAYTLFAHQRACAALSDAQAETKAWQAERETLLQRLGEHAGQARGAQFAPLWSQEGLQEQPRMTDYAVQAEPAGYSPATTEWQVAEREIPDALTETGASRYDSPGELLMALSEAWQMADSLGTDLWEVSWRVLFTNEQSAVGLILLWGWMDDAVAGTDYRVTLSNSSEGWGITQVEERHHCRRGVTGDCQSCV